MPPTVTLLLGRFDRPDWYDDAPCRGAAKLFFTEDDKPVKAGWEHRLPADDRERALHTCLGCIYRLDCLELALSVPISQDHGIWGGTTAPARRTIRKHRRQHQPVT